MINLTIQGTDRAINIIDMANNTAILTNSSQANNINYSNYLIQFGEIHTNLTLSAIKLSQDKVFNDAFYMVLLGIIFISALYFFKKVKRI
jgi:hypothetical protein